MGARNSLMATPMMLADVVRYVFDLLLNGLALAPAAYVFFLLWRIDALYARILAVPAAFAAATAAFPVAILILRVIFVRKIIFGSHALNSPRALRWIIADAFIKMIHRSFLAGYVIDFGPQRYLIYRALGAKIDSTFFIGWGTKILDPWALEAGRNVIIGSFAIVSGHSVEGNTVYIAPVRIGDNVTVGMRSIIMPGARIGAGAIIAAGAVVRKDAEIPAGEIWGGVPARKIGVVAENSEIA